MTTGSIIIFPFSNDIPMRIPIFLLTAIVLAANIHVTARNIPARTALDRALRAGQSATDMRRSPAVRPTYSLAYSTPAGSYHVFNRSNGGYIVVSGDDEIYPILADVETGTFVMDSLAPAAQSLLLEYDAQIRSFSTTGMPDAGLADYYSRWTEVSPLMSTQWNQTYPYNKFCPAIDGRTCVTGCVATAMAQVVRTIGYYEGKGYRYTNSVNDFGERVEFDYENATFDFDNMFDRYPSAASQESIDGVARLMLACGLGVGMNYGVSESGAQNVSVPRALIEHFGFDSKYTRIYDNGDFSQAQWENMLYRQLQIGRPVYYSGAGRTSAHAFVIDGYRTAGLYHVNWGWGGVSDGYFRLTALNPSQVGTGGSGGGYSMSQHMVCAVPPGTDPGVVYGEMSGSISMVSDGVFAVYYKSNGNNLFNVSIGAVIVDEAGKQVEEATFWQGQNITASSALRHDALSYDFSQHPLAPGDYRIYPAFRPDGGEYTITDALHDRPHFVHLTVTGNKEYILSNSPAAAVSTDVHIAGIVPGYDLHEGFSGSVGFYVVNNGNLDYKGTFSLSLLDGNGAEIASGTSQRVTVAAATNAIVYCPVPVFDTDNRLIPAGTYSLRFTDGDGNPLSDGEFGIEVRKGMPFAEWEPEEGIEVTNCASVPQMLLSGETWPHTPLIYTQQTHRNMTLRLAFYSPAGTSALHSLLCFEGTINPMQSLFPLDPVAVNVPFGTYEVCYRKGYSQISQRWPMRIGVSVGDIGYYPTDGGGASATLTDGKRDLEEAVIPARVRVGDTDLPVTAIEPEAFMTDRNLSVVDLPSGIEKIGFNAFTACPSLRQIILRSARPPFSLRNHIAPGLSSTTEFYVPAEAYDDYKPLLEAYNPVYALVEAVGSKETVVPSPSATVSLPVSPAHEAVNPAFAVTPADEVSAALAEVEIAAVEPGKLHLEVKALRPGRATFHVRPAHRSDDYAVLTLTIPHAAPTLDLAAGSYVIGRRLNIVSAEGTNVVYSVNGGDEVTVSGNAASYRFPAPGEYRIKARTVPAAGDGNRESGWTDEVTYHITENILHAPADGAYYPFTPGPLGIGTFAALQSYVMPEGLKGGTVTVDGDEATVTYRYTAGTVVPARTALMLKGTPGTEYRLMLTDKEGGTDGGNRLLPALTYDRIAAAAGTKSYIFANDAEYGPGFYFQGADGDGSAVEGIYGKAYLSVEATNAIRGFVLRDGEATGIGGTGTDAPRTAGKGIYTIGGVRVGGTAEGLPAGFYIVDGRKVIVK